MGVTREATEPDTRDAERGRTTLELIQLADGRWQATQAGVDLVGTGETGALAVMDYCRQVQEAIDGE